LVVVLVVVVVVAFAAGGGHLMNLPWASRHRLVGAGLATVMSPCWRRCVTAPVVIVAAVAAVEIKSAAAMVQFITRMSGFSQFALQATAFSAVTAQPSVFGSECP
jgi:hypothetical protein